MRDSNLFLLLTPRERQVMFLVSKGFSNKICADRLGCSIRTIEAHRASIFRKLKVRNALEMVNKLYQFQQLL